MSDTLNRSFKDPRGEDTRKSHFIVDRKNCKIICLGLIHQHNTNNRAIIETINLYCDVIIRKGLHTSVDINQIFSLNQKLYPEIELNFKNPLDVRNFLEQYPEIFCIDKDRVSFTNPNIIYNGHVNWIITLLQKDFPGINNTVINAIQFYSDILCQNKLEYFPICQLVTHRNKAKEDVQLIAGNPVELKAFLTAVPQIFLVFGDKVKLQDAALSLKSDYDWLEKLIYCERRETIIYHKAVEYYVNVLSKFSPPCQIPILSLFAFQRFSPSDVHQLTKTEEEFKIFLSNYPDVFTVCDEMIKPNDLLLQLFKKEKNLIEKNDECNTPGFLFKKYLEIVKTICLLEVPLKYLMDEYLNGIQEKEQLKAFLSIYSEHFVIKDDKVVHKPFYFQIIDKKFDIRKYENFLNVNADTNNDRLQILIFCLWILRDKVGVEIEFPISRLKVYMDLILLDHKLDMAQLKSFLRRFTDFLIVRYSTVTLKRIVDLGKVLSCNIYIEKYSRYEKYYIESYSITQGINFYSNILKNVLFNFEVPIKYLFGYKSLASLEVMALAKDSNDLTKFFAAHPDIFNVRGDYVSLINFTNNKKCDFQFDKVKSKIAVEFYASIIKKFSSKNLECPIVILFGYRYLAPEDVRDLIKTCLELKHFLGNHPGIFSVNKDSVVLESQIYGNPDVYCTLLKCSSYPNFDLRSLHAKSQEIAKKKSEHSNISKSEHSDINKNEHSNISKSEHSDINKNEHSDINKSEHSDINRSDSAITRLKYKKSGIIETILFFSDILFKKGPTLEQKMSYLISHRDIATKEIQEITREPKKVRLLFSKFPQLFLINFANDTIKLADIATYYKNQREWIKELLPRYHYSTSNHETIVSGIQFYANIIFENSSKYETTVKYLFSCRKTALDDVQSLAKTIVELKNYLLMYPEIFTINGERVSLNPQAINRKTKWIEELLLECNIDFENTNSNLCDLNEKYDQISLNSDSSVSGNTAAIEDSKTMKAIDFFISILTTEGKDNAFTCDQLFELQNTAPEEVKTFLTSPLALKDFFMEHPNVFFVKNDIVKLFISKNKEKNLKVKTKKNKKIKSLESDALVKDSISYKTESINSEEGNGDERDKNNLKSDIECTKFKTANTILFYLNVLCRKGPHLEHSISKLFSHQSKIMISTYKIFKNSKELQAFLSRYDQLFAVNHEKFTVTITDLSQLQNYQQSWIKEVLPKYHNSITNHKAIVSTIQFYSNIIFEKAPVKELNVSCLFSYRGGALEDVKNTTRNVKELENFFLTYPEIFSVNKNIVSLTSSAVLQKSQPKWIKEIIIASKTKVRSYREEKIEVDLEEDKKKNRIAINKTVQFCYRLISSNISNNGFSLQQLINLINDAPADVREIASNASELHGVLSKFPHLFTIIDDEIFLTNYFNRAKALDTKNDPQDKSKRMSSHTFYFCPEETPSNSRYPLYKNDDH